MRFWPTMGNSIKSSFWIWYFLLVIFCLIIFHEVVLQNIRLLWHMIPHICWNIGSKSCDTKITYLSRCSGIDPNISWIDVKLRLFGLGTLNKSNNDLKDGRCTKLSALVRLETDHFFSTASRKNNQFQDFTRADNLVQRPAFGHYLIIMLQGKETEQLGKRWK